MDEGEEALERSFDCRTRAWELWGAVDGDVLGHLVNPFFAGGPRWPALRESFRVARRQNAILVASDGLSDPYDPGEGPTSVNGLGLEVFAWTSDRLGPIPASWLFQMVWQASQFAASRGDLKELLDEYGLLSTELYRVSIPPEHQSRFVGVEGRVGVLLNLNEAPLPSSVPGPLSDIRLVSLKLLTLDELAFAVEHGPDGRSELARRFAAPIQASSLLRTSVLSAGRAD